MTSRHLVAAMGLFVLAVFGFALLAPRPDRSPPPAAPATVAPSPSASATTPTAYDVRPLLRPAGEYLGVALHGAPQDMSRVDAYADRTGTRPNMITIYESFDDAFAAAEIRKIHRYGALPVLRWEPYRHPLAEIAGGRYDAYLTDFAAAVRRTNVPIVLTVAHEMNGHWYPWGADKNDPADFVAAWRHVHTIFDRADATNVIWAWTPNVVNHLPDAPLRPLYPGDAYVDWIGMDGYFTHRGEQTFKQLFQPTMTEVRRFTDRPFLIVETGAEPGALRARALNDLFTHTARRDDVLGFVYFNQRGSGDWVIDTDKPALKVFHSHPDRSRFGFTVP